MNVFVGCSSRAPQNRIYEESCKVAKELADWIVEKHHNYVFGAGKTGLMGVIYNEVQRKLQEDAPLSDYNEELSVSDSTKIIAVTLDRRAEDLKELECDIKLAFNTLSERKQVLFQLADVMIFLPGGLGTIDELISAIEAKRSFEHQKEIIICNVCGYFDSVVNAIDYSVNKGFTGSLCEDFFRVVNSEAELVETLNFLQEQSQNKDI